MTNNNPEENKPKLSVESQAPAEVPQEALIIQTLIQSIAAPIADADKVKEVEQTKRFEKWNSTLRLLLWLFFSIGFSVLIIGGIALLLDKDQLTEKIITGLFGFLGGIGVGRVFSNVGRQ